MSILIKGLEMPEDCVDCYCSQLYGDGYLYCELLDKRFECVTLGGKRSPDCPLIEVPEHRDLIDRDELIKEINNRIDAAIKWGVNAIADGNSEIKIRAEQAVATFCEASLTAKKLPTVIPADTDLETLPSGVYNPPVKESNYPPGQATYRPPINWCGEEAIGDGT